MVIRLQAMVDDPIRPHLFTHLDRTNGGLVVGAYDCDLIPALKLSDCSLRHEQSLLFSAGLDANTAVLARTQDVAGIGKRSDKPNCAGIGIYLPVSPQDLAVVRIYGTVRQDQFWRTVEELQWLPGRTYAPGPQIFLFAHGKVDFYRIYLRHVRQMR